MNDHLIIRYRKGGKANGLFQLPDHDIFTGKQVPLMPGPYWYPLATRFSMC